MRAESSATATDSQEATQGSTPSDHKRPEAALQRQSSLFQTQNLFERAASSAFLSEMNDQG